MPPYNTLSDFDYHLPEKLIAQEPQKRRGNSRLLVLNRQSGSIAHQKFPQIINHLRSGDVLVVNQSRVLKARLIGHNKTGGKREVLLLTKNYDKTQEVWSCLIGGKNVVKGDTLNFESTLTAEILDREENHPAIIEFNLKGEKFLQKLEKIGQTPLPPYIKTTKNFNKKYQTVYAKQSEAGSAAAPTAGLHFTQSLIAKLQKKGVIIAPIILNVGLGTFAPVKTEDLDEHKMHTEKVEIPMQAAQTILQAKQENRRVIAVGTTSVRAMEGVLAHAIKNGAIQPKKLIDTTNIFIRPGFKFKFTDALITNFHTPKSTLLMLVSALGGYENIKNAYREAIKNEYRFFSFGDAMMIE